MMLSKERLEKPVRDEITLFSLSSWHIVLVMNSQVVIEKKAAELRFHGNQGG